MRVTFLAAYWVIRILKTPSLQAHEACLQAAREEHAAADSALRCVSAGIESFVRAKDFEKLRDVAQASNVAHKVCCAAF